MENLTARIEQWLAPKLEELDCFLVDIKVKPSGSKIEVYIDRDKGLQIETCEQVSRFLEFHLDNEADVTITFTDLAYTTSTGTSVLGGVNPGFSLYSGLAHLAPLGADYDTAAGSVVIRDTDSGGAFTEGAFRALDTWRITNDANDPATVFTYVGSAYDGSVDYGTGVIAGGDGVADNSVSQTFHLAAGDYSIFVGGTDYSDQVGPWSSYGVEGMVSVVPEPEIYAMLLIGLGLVSVTANRRRLALQY